MKARRFTAQCSRASDRKDSTPQLRQETVRCGISIQPIPARGPARSLGDLGSNVRFARKRDEAGRFMSAPPTSTAGLDRSGLRLTRGLPRLTVGSRSSYSACVSWPQTTGLRVLWSVRGSKGLIEGAWSSSLCYGGCVAMPKRIQLYVRSVDRRGRGLFPPTRGLWVPRRRWGPSVALQEIKKKQRRAAVSMRRTGSRLAMLARLPRMPKLPKAILREPPYQLKSDTVD
jgi:hypothetical protein